MTVADAAKQLFALGLAALDAGEFPEAETYFAQTLESLPSSLSALSNLLFCKFRLGKLDEIVDVANRIIAIDKDNIDAYQALALSHKELSRHELALIACDQVISRDRKNVQALNNKGAVLNNLGRHEEAIAVLAEALALNPRMADALVNRGNAQRSLKKFSAALSSYDAALAIKPDLDIAWLGRANALADLQRLDEALDAYTKALSIKPDLKRAWLGRGNVLAGLKRYDDALECFDKALSIDPDLAGAWIGRANVFCDLRRYDDALAACDKALSIDPDLVGGEGFRLHMKMHLCSWENLDAEINHLAAAVRDGKNSSDPFSLLSLVDLPGEQLRCASAWVAPQHPQLPAMGRRSSGADGKISIGYVSSDFFDHATARLMAGLFECHDRVKFTVAAFSFGPDDSSDMRRRLARSFDTFLDCRHLSDAEIARAVAEAGIDILVDLKGFTTDARTSVFAHRAAPIQVNYLGYPGTMGAPYIDYIIGDKLLFTPADAAAYSEKLVMLPDSYQPNDRKRRISEKRYSRKDIGLPQDGFVFCCFNNNYKILPDVFASWMRILKSLDGSVLWLLAESRTAIANLKKEAAARGVEPSRLIFADRMDMPEHLARHRCADLFLDTLPYNAHTTASDALWAGLPVLTQIGNTFAGRVAASLLNAVSMPELITRSREEYEAIAFELALNPKKLQAFKERLAATRLAAPLFDTPRYTKHLEAAYEAMYRRHKAGLSPEHIEINQP